MKNIMTTATIKMNNVTVTRIHLPGEIRFSSLTREVQKWFVGHTTNHFGVSEPVLQDCLIEIADDIICEIEMGEYNDNDIIIFADIKDFDDMIVDYAVLAAIFA